MKLLQEISKKLNEFTGSVDLKNSDATDAGKNDVVDKANDISFSLMRNTINTAGEVTGSDVANYLERAAEINDEVDTVPFGLETDDGEIVKVYVNAEQADAFEEALSQLLGLEDDIEEAINRLSTTFDIIDVVWPKGSEPVDPEAEADPDANLSIDDTGFDDDDDEMEIIATLDDTADVAPPRNDSEEADPEDPDTPVDPDTAKDGAEIPKDTENGDTPKDDEQTDSDPDGETEETPPEDEDEDDDTDPDKPKKSKKDKEKKDGDVKESKRTPMSIGSSFLNRIVNEASDIEDRDGVRDGFNIPLDAQARILASKLKRSYEKKLVALFFMSGVPGRYLNTAEIEEAIAGAADMLRKKISVRRALDTFYDALATSKGFNLPAETVEENQKSLIKVGDTIKIIGDKYSDTGKLLNTKQKVKAVGIKKNGQRTYIVGKGEVRVFEKDIELVESLTEARKRGSMVQKLYETVLVALGLPETYVVSNGPAAIGTGIYRTAEMIEQDSNLEQALRALAIRLGIKTSDVVANVTESRLDVLRNLLNESDTVPLYKITWVEGYHGDPAPEIHSLDWFTWDMGFKEEEQEAIKALRIGEVHNIYGVTDEVEIERVADGKKPVNEDVNVGQDEFANVVVKLAIALGVPEDILNLRRQQLISSLRNKKLSLRNRARVLMLIDRVMDELAKNPVPSNQEPQVEESLNDNPMDDLAEKIEDAFNVSVFQYGNDKHRGVKFGDYRIEISRDGAGFDATLRKAGMILKNGQLNKGDDVIEWIRSGLKAA